MLMQRCPEKEGQRPAMLGLAMLQVRYKAASRREAYRVLHGSAAKRVVVS
ncbi:hypothetical protein [Paenibacillus silvae]|nr:hypothetical protein [Paenibacillus silvae]MCK6076332.1 hypothetical protein [Paenibacillus silvae]MCK6078313.1 hypothetical protein [Paenibacillus silvae]MCK6150509.1 hypothetical protein [Paenibacillus silvae]